MDARVRGLVALGVLTTALACNAIFGNETRHLVVEETGGASNEGGPKPKTCVLNTDCSLKDVCIFGICSPPCVGDRDCDMGFRCLKTNKGVACVSSDQAACNDSSCPSGTSCIDGSCRDQCSAADAGGCAKDQTCSSNGTCVGVLRCHDPNSTGPVEDCGVGGTTSAGGVSGSGGTTSSGGATDTGGASSGGGTTNAGGTSGSGGTTNTGGTTSTGGAANTGGKANTGGTTGSGGKANTGGTTGSGGKANTGGTTGSGGSPVDSGVPGSSCQGLTDSCGSSHESCCKSLPVKGTTGAQTFYRGYDNVTYTDMSAPATVSDFQLDKFEVTVGRFRNFEKAWDDGWRPSAGDGKHAHLNGGKGLTVPSATFEAGWNTSWVSLLPDSASAWDTELTCDAPNYTWSPTASGKETDPLNCESWYEAYAFCIWDGGFLPSEAEWDYTAAGGTKQLPYPWGTSAPGSNTDLANYGCKYGNDASVRCHGADSIAPVGLIDAGKGTYGQEDLAGNLSEWTLDGFAAYATPCADCAQLTAISTRVVRGGNFHTNSASLITSFRDKYMPQNGFYFVGARCARAPE